MQVLKKELSRKAFALILVALFLTSGVSVFATWKYAQATLPSQTNLSYTPSNLAGTMPCTYLIETDGTYYYAIDCNTHALAYGGPANAGGATGTNASGVIESALKQGGTDIITSGTFPLTKGLTMLSNSKLECSGIGSTILSDSSQNNAAGSPNNMIVLNNVANVTITGCSLSGNALSTTLANSTTGFGIDVEGSTNYILHDLAINYFRQDAIAIGETSESYNGSIANIQIHENRGGIIGVSEAQNLNIQNVIGYAYEGLDIEHGPIVRINVNNVILVHNDLITPGTATGYALQELANTGNIQSITENNLDCYGEWLSCYRVYAQSPNTITNVEISNAIANGEGVASNSGFVFLGTRPNLISGLTVSNSISQSFAAASGWQFENITSPAYVTNSISNSSGQQGFYVSSSSVYFTNDQAINNNVQNAGGNAGFYISNDFGSSTNAFLTNCFASNILTTGHQNYGVRGVTSPVTVTIIGGNLSGNSVSAILIGTGNFFSVSTVEGVNPQGSLSSYAISSHGIINTQNLNGVGEYITVQSWAKSGSPSINIYEGLTSNSTLYATYYVPSATYSSTSVEFAFSFFVPANYFFSVTNSTNSEIASDAVFGQ